MKYSKDGYKRNSKDKNNPYNVIPSGNITMKDVDFPVFGMDNLGNSKVMLPGANYTFPGNSVFEIPIRKGVRKNPDGSESTHLMRAETIDGINWVSFPTLFQNLDGSWLDMSDEENWKLSMMEAKKRGELIYFGTDKKAALEFAEGSWKPDEKSIVNKQKTIPMLSDGGEDDENVVAYSRLLKRFIPSAAVLAKNPLLTFTASMLYPKSAGKGSTLKTPSLKQQYQNYLNFTTPEERIKSELEYEVMTGRPFVFDPIPISDIKEHGGEFQIGGGFVDIEDMPKEEEIDQVDVSKEKQELLEKLNSQTFLDRYKKNWFRVTGEEISDENAKANIQNQIDFTGAGADYGLVFPYNPDGNFTYSPYSNIQRDYAIASYERRLDNARNKYVDGDFVPKTPDELREDGSIYPDAYNYPYMTGYQYDYWGNIKPGVGSIGLGPRDVIVHELAHSYNTNKSKLWDSANYTHPALKEDGSTWSWSNLGHYDAYGGYKDFLGSIFGENYLQGRRGWRGHAEMPAEISSAKAETETRLKDAGIWDYNQSAFSSTNLDNMLNQNFKMHGSKKSDVGESDLHLESIGYNDLLDQHNIVKEFNKDVNKLSKINDLDENYWTNIKGPFIIDDNWMDIERYIDDFGLENAYDSKDLSAYVNLANKSLKEKHQFNSIDDAYNVLNETKDKRFKKKEHERAKTFINTFMDNIKDDINKSIEEESEKQNIKLQEKRNEVEPKMKMYFNEIVMDDQGGDGTFARYGKELFQAKDGFDFKGYFKGEQGFIPDYGGKSTTETYQDVSKDVQKVADAASMTGIPGVSQLAGYTSAGIDAIDAGIAYSQGDYDTAKKELGKSAAGALISTIPGGKTVAGLTKTGFQTAGKNLAKGTVKGGVKNTIKNIIGGNNDTPIYAENLEQPIDGGMLPEVTVTPKTKYGTELPIAQVGTFKTLAQKGLNAYNKYMFNKSKDAFGISGRMLMDDLTLPVANSANLMLHRSLDNTYIPNLSGSDLDNYYKLITQYTINSEPFKFSSFPKNSANFKNTIKEVSFPMQPSFMNEDGTPLYTFDNRFATQLNDIINSNKVIFKGDQNKPLTLVREFEGFTDVPVGKDFYLTKDYYGDVDKLNSYIDALKSGKIFNLGDISSWSVGANTGLNRFGSNRFIIKDFPLSQNALVNKYDSPLFSKNQKGIFRERELLLPSETQFKVRDIQFNVPRKPYHYTKDDAGKITDFSPHYGTDIILDVQTKKKGGQTKYKKSVFNKNKMSLSNPSRLINQMLKQGIFKAEFKMGGEQKLDNGYTVKKEFDNANNIPFISYTNEPDIEGRVYYEADNDAKINVIDIETKLNQIRSKHERTKKIILKRRQGESLSNAEKQHLNSLGLL